jgi:O-acetyl-ADP-ribose deacetylase (regulator of RNase III)
MRPTIACSAVFSLSTNVKCIDNGTQFVPSLDRDCVPLAVAAQRRLQPEGHAKVTAGFNLLAPYVIHTVSPRMRAGTEPSAAQRRSLEQCYRSCLSAAEELPANADGRNILVFCGISTGVFGFPADEGCKIATRTVMDWSDEHPSPAITDVVSDVFSDWDLELHITTLKGLAKSGRPGLPVTKDTSPPGTFPSLARSPRNTKAQQLLQEADFLLISAGAGLSAADGLDYTSPELFKQHLPGFLKYGFRRLYDVFGFQD